MEYEKVDIPISQPFKGCPVVKIGERYFPTTVPVEKGVEDGKYWFVYGGVQKFKLTIDTNSWTETLEEVTE